MKDIYCIGYSTMKMLKPLAKSDGEHAAIDRLAVFTGTANDVELAASLFERAGAGAHAEELRRILGKGAPR